MNKYVTELLKKYINNETIEYDEKANYKEAFKLATNSAVSGMLADAFMNVMPKEMIPTLQKYYLATYQKCVIFDNVFKEICEEFEARKINIVTYKGIMLKKLYPEPNLRIMGDIDFVFNEKDAKEVIEIFTNWGYESDIHDNHYVFTKGYIIIEMHSSFHTDELSEFEDILVDYKNNLKEINNYQYIHTLNSTYHLMYLITHLTKHILHGGAGIRNYIDIALFIKHYDNEIDYQFIENQLDKINLKSFYLNILGFTKKSFNEDIKVKDINEETYIKFLNFTYAGNAYGLLGKQKHEIAYSTSGKSKLAFRFSKAFPNFERLQTMYPKLKYKIQIPYYWIKRLLKIIFKERSKITQNLHYDDKRILEFNELLNNMEYKDIKRN